MPALSLPPRSGDAIADLAAWVLAMKPEHLAEVMRHLPAAEVELIERVLAEQTGQGWRASPLDMAVTLSAKGGGAPIKRWRYTKLLSDKFVDAVEGRSRRQIWNLPARYGKSIFGSQWGPTWALDRNPAMKIILASYGDELARNNATAVRDLLVAHGDVLRARLRRDRRRADRFVTVEGGGLISAGIGSALTGFGGDGAIVDDPFKNWVEAHSEARRQTVWDWYRSVLRLRLETDESWIIVIMTRWHEEDLSGKLIETDLRGEGEGWEVVRLPAIAEAPSTNPLDPPYLHQPDLLGRAPGEPLEPERFSVVAVRARAVALGSYLAAGLEQQRPAPEEGSDIMRGWWKVYSVPPPRYDDALTSWDMKLKDKESGDFVVGQAWGRTGSDFWMSDTLKGQWNVPTTKAAIALLAVRNPHCRRHIIENTGNGPEVMQQLRAPAKGYTVSADVAGKLGMTGDERAQVERILRRGMTGLMPENPKGDKRARMRAYTPLIEAGNVHVPDDERGHGLINQAAVFPNGTHDDEVDALSQGLKRLSGGGGKIERPTGSHRTPPAGARATAKRAGAGGGSPSRSRASSGGRIVKPRRR